MKKRLAVLISVMMVGCMAINSLLFHTGHWRLIEVEKMVILVVAFFYAGQYAYRQAQETMYSYKLMTNVGLIIFIGNTAVAQAWRLTTLTRFGMVEFYESILDSFATFVYMMQPLVIALALMLIASNIALIRHENMRVWRNYLSIGLGVALLVGSGVATNIYHYLAGVVDTTDTSMAAMIYVAEASVCVVVAYLECMLWAAIICTLKAERYRPALNQDYMIILGCKVERDGQPSASLRRRVQRALEFGSEQKEAAGPALTYVPSGGQGTDETVSEAAAMKKMLRQNGVATAKILLEDQSTNTRENMRFSKRVIENNQRESRVAFATSGYHVWRSGVLAHEIGLRAVGIGCRDKWYYYNNALVREFVANLYARRWEHVFHIT